MDTTTPTTTEQPAAPRALADVIPNAVDGAGLPTFGFDSRTIHEQYRARGYQTVAVAMSYDPPAYVSNFAASRKLPFGVAIDNTGEVARRFGEVRLTPTTVLINKRGEIVKRFVGEPDFNALHALIEQLLAQS